MRVVSAYVVSPCSHSARSRRWLRGAIRTTGLTLGVTLAACGSSNAKVAAPATTVVAAAPADAGASSKGNACPVEGCLVEVTAAEKSGTELSLTFTANFDPDVSRNHIHVYWDHFTAAQVSNNAESTGGVAKGSWIPTKVVNGFVTQGAVSLQERLKSTKVCVTAGDRNHDVIDVKKFTCRDVTSLVA